MRKSLTLQASQSNRGFWLVTAASILWGTIGVATQAIYSIDSTSSLFINVARMLIAVPILFTACWRIVGARTFDVPRRDLLVMLFSGIMISISQASYFAAIRYTGVTIATLLTISISPLVVSGVSVALKLETINKRIIAALLCALIGGALLVGLGAPNDLQAEPQNLALGTFFSVIAALTYAGVIVCGRFLAGGYHPLQVTAISFAAGTIMLVILNLFSGIVVVQTTQGWLLVLYLGFVPTALGYWWFQKGLRSVSATTASIVAMLDPVVAAVLAWILFNETLAPAGIIGAALLLLSVYLLSTQTAHSNT